MSSIRNIKDVLIGAGFSRMFIVFFYGERHAKLTGQKLADHFQVANPINPDQIYLRTSLYRAFAKLEKRILIIFGSQNF